MARLAFLGLGVFAVLGVACSAGNEKESGGTLTPDTGVSGDDTSVPGDDSDVPVDSGTGISTDADLSDVPIVPVNDPATCEEAASAKAYVGCDFWPTVTGNIVWSIFDYAVAVANAGANDAEVEVTGPNSVSQKVTVPAGGLQTIYLPWVPALKGADTNECGVATPLPGSVLARKSAYHLVSSRPVTVYQFNALEYKPAGGPAGKDWSMCPGTTTKCASQGNKPIGCFSYSNDASLLLPSTAMTGNYRVTGIHGWSVAATILTPARDVMGSYVVVTATQDATKLLFKVGKTGKILAGGTEIAAKNPGETLEIMLDAGDVVELVGESKVTSDLSGSLVTADKPVQVLAGIPCINNPLTTTACDHMEESVFPAETLGKDYFVTVPTAPSGKPVAHSVRIYGNRDATKLTYAPAKPAGAPDTINAGDVVTIPNATGDFRVTGDHEFAVGSFMQGGSKVDPLTGKGDPAMSFSTSSEQYRRKYIFLAPMDYDVSYADVVIPDGTAVKIDGVNVPAGTKIGATGYSIARVKLGAGKSGAHELVSSKPVGLQVMGYGSYTSYQYPGGLNLTAIAEPPPK